MDFLEVSSLRHGILVPSHATTCHQPPIYPAQIGHIIDRYENNINIYNDHKSYANGHKWTNG